MYSSSATGLLALLPYFPHILVSAATAPAASPPSELSVRLPPYLDPALNGSSSSNHSKTSSSSSSSSWVAPPDYFFAGTWYITNTSNPTYSRMSNLQWDIIPAIPTCASNSTSSCPPGTVAGSILDISSWAILNSTASKQPSFGAIGGGNRPAASTVGWDTPHRVNHPELGPEWDGVFDFAIVDGPANGYRESWAFTYWGVDAKDVPFVVIHEGLSTVNGTAAYPTCLDVLSRSPEGPTPGALADVLQALEDLGSEDLRKNVKEIGATAWDCELVGGPAICDKRCQTNGAEK